MKWEKRERVVETAQRQQTRLLVEQPVELVDRPSRAEQVQQRTGIDRAGAGAHRRPFQRREAHRRVHRVPVPDGGDRAAATEMADDEARRVDLLDDRLHGEPVEPEPNDRPELGRERVAARLLRDRAVEGRVGDRHVGNVGERLARLPERVERGPVVERGDGGARLDRGEDPIVDDRRLDHEAAEVDDPVADRVGGREVVDGRGRLAVDERELQAGRAGVDDEDVQ